MKIIKDFLLSLVFVTFTIILFIFLKEGIRKEERRECLQWRRWNQEIRKDLFSPSEEMIEYCKQRGIDISNRY